MDAYTCQFCGTDINASDPRRCQTRNEALHCPWFTGDARKDYLREREQTRMARDLAAITRRRIFANARALAGRQFKRVPNWAFAKDLFGVGSTYAWALCEEMGIDGDACTATGWAPVVKPLLSSTVPIEE